MYHSLRLQLSDYNSFPQGLHAHENVQLLTQRTHRKTITCRPNENLISWTTFLYRLEKGIHTFKINKTLELEQFLFLFFLKECNIFHLQTGQGVWKIKKK